MIPEFPISVPPFPGWVRHEYRVSRPVTDDDVAAFSGNEELSVRDTAAGPVNIVQKYGLAEHHFIVGKARIEIWINPEKGAWPAEYLDALLATRFN